MKIEVLFILMMIISSPLLAQDQEPLIVLEEETSQRESSVQPFVESGSDVIVGSPEENIKAAYRSWKTACNNWKQELKANNKSNIMIASCGSPKRRVDKVQITTFYVYESKSVYKIKVGCSK